LSHGQPPTEKAIIIRKTPTQPLGFGPWIAPSLLNVIDDDQTWSLVGLGLASGPRCLSFSAVAFVVHGDTVEQIPSVMLPQSSTL